MALDLKKEFKDLYMAKPSPTLVNVPRMNYIAVRGKGDPNNPVGDYQAALQILYTLAYTLKMSYKTDYKIKDFVEYVAPPLEGFWWQEGVIGVDYSNKSSFNWISVIRLPDFITEQDFDWAITAAKEKKKLDCSKAEFLTMEEGLCVQVLHLGPYDDEPASVAKLNAFIAENGYVADFSDTRMHHEIYLSDPRKVQPEQYKTIIRHPIRQGVESAQPLHTTCAGIELYRR